MLFPASFKLVLTCCSCLHRLLPWVASCSLVMHHARLCIMSCLCVVCLPCCVLLLDSFPFCCDREDSFVYAWFVFVASSSSWTRSSSLRDFRQDDRYPGSHYYHCYASCFVLSLCCATYCMFFKPPNLPCQPLTFSPFLANRCLAMLPLLLSLSYSVASCRWSRRFLHGGHDFGWDITISLIYLMHLYTW